MKSESAYAQTAKTAPTCPPHHWEYPCAYKATSIGTCKKCGKRQISSNNLVVDPEPIHGDHPAEEANNPNAFSPCLRLVEGCVEGVQVGQEIFLVEKEPIVGDEKKATHVSRVMVIGRRSKHTDPHIIGHYVVVQDDYVSREHLKISREGKHFVLNVRSRPTPGGTFVKEENTDGGFKEVLPSKPHTLKHGDLIGMVKDGKSYRVLLRFKSSEDTVIPFPETTEDATDDHAVGIKAEPPKAGLEINLDSHVVRSNGQVVKLNPREWKVLVFLYQNQGKPCSQKDIGQKDIGQKALEGAADKDSLKQIIHGIKTKIMKADPSHPTYIKNVRGYGYRLDL